MDFLTAEQHDKFAETNKLFGLGPLEFSAGLSPQALTALPQRRVMASTGESNFPAHIISIGSIQELRAIVGHTGPFVPPPHGSEPSYPAPLSPDESARFRGLGRTELKPAVTPELADRITQAAAAYVMGDPAKVESYVDLINALKFPGRAAVFTGDVLDIPAGATHVLAGEDPVLLNFGQIKLAPGATLKIEAEFFINTQTFVQSPPAAASALGDPSPPTINLTGAPWTTPAPTGAQGDPAAAQTNTGTNGKSHYDGGNCTNVCDTQPQSGPKGNTGGTGKIGTQGQLGRPSPAGVTRLGVLTQPVNVLIGAGGGQQGGKGGPGAGGGGGGQPGSTATGCNNNVGVGATGTGGQGGTGGTGGPGGISGFASIYYTWTGSGQGVTVTVVSVDGGAGGDPGDPGTGATSTDNQGPGSRGGVGPQGAVPQFALYNQ